MSVNRNLPLYTAEWIYGFTGLRLINYIPFYRYIFHNLCAKWVSIQLVSSAKLKGTLILSLICKDSKRKVGYAGLHGKAT